MSKNNKSKQFFPDDELNRDRIIAEVPAEQKSPYQERIPSGYDPMGEIYLRGRAFRGLVGGRIPWWVLISGWIMFGSSALVILIYALTLKSFSALPALIIVTLPLIIIWRGTMAKLSIKKHQSPTKAQHL